MSTEYNPIFAYLMENDMPSLYIDEWILQL